MILMFLQNVSNSSNPVADAFAAIIALFFIFFLLDIMLVSLIIMIVMWLVMGLVILLLFIGMIFWTVMLIDCVQRDDEDFPNNIDNPKTTWIIILLATLITGLAWLGAFIYYLMVKKEKQKPTFDKKE